MSTTGDSYVSAIELRDQSGYIPLVQECFIDCGSAARLMGGLYSLRAGKQTKLFHPASKYAKWAGVSRRSVFRHLATLHNAGWIQWLEPENRRTATVDFTNKAWAAIRDTRYFALPKWFPPSPWAAAVVYAVLFSRALLLETHETEHGETLDELGEEIRFSLRHLTERTALSPRSVRNGIEWLEREALIGREVYAAEDQLPSVYWLVRP